MWKASDAKRHTKKANTPCKKRAFAHAANSVLKKTGDEGRAVRAGNAAASRASCKTKKR